MPTSLKVLTPYARFVEKWKHGCGGEICSKATKVCLARGTVPADVCFIGEGPGISEDVLGRPFKGPAGKLLDKIIRRAWGDFDEGGHPCTLPYSYAITNLVGCLPRDEEGDKAHEPEEEDVKRCQPRLEEFLELVQPRLVVGVGKLAENWLDQGYKVSIKLPKSVEKVISIVHPAAILRMTVAQQGMAVQRAVVILSNALEDL